MRSLSVIFSIALSACVCSPSEPKSVTLRLKNTSASALFIDQSDGRLGMQVQRSVGGQWLSFVETPACACQACDMICGAGGTCDCPMPTPMVQKVESGTNAERTWSGLVQVSSAAGCGGFGGTSCLNPENAPYNETFNLHLCYALSADVPPSLDGGAVEGMLPTDTTCVDKQFQIDDGLVEISPQRGADCVTSADCRGPGELCFSGACTASCPNNTYPQIGNNWDIGIGITDMGFFDSVTDVNGRTIFTGTGTISSAAYSGNSVRIHLTRTGSSGEALNGVIAFTVPPNELGPLTAGAPVSVKSVQPSMTENPDNAALIIRAVDDGGTLLVAADSAQNGPLLSGDDVQPFTVAFNQDTVGCRSTDCGKLLFSTTTFTLSGGQQVNLEPGGQANLVSSAGTYRAVNVDAQRNGMDAMCDPADIRPYLIWQDKPPGG
jgi:hypothetical protein